MSVDGVHLEASLPSPASCGAVSLQIPLPWNLWFHTSLGPCCSPGIPADTSISLLPLGMVYRMGFTQYLAASSGLVTTTQGWYPYLAPVLAPPRQVSLYTILVSAATGLQDHSTPLQVHLLGHHIWHILVYEVDTLRMPSQVIWEVVCQDTHLRTPI
jgi:hypothetical protein